MDWVFILAVIIIAGAFCAWLVLHDDKPDKDGPEGKA